MNRTSITGVPQDLKSDFATGYEYADNAFQPLKFQWFNTYPASDINSTAPDMARYMLAQLAGGTLDGKRSTIPPMPQLNKLTKAVASS